MADMETGRFPRTTEEPPAADRVMPLFSLKGRTAIVTGAGGGVGLSVARAFAEAGANVAIWYNRNQKAVDDAAEIAETFGVKCKAYAVNVQSEEAVTRAVADIVAEFDNRLDVFVANSGIGWEDGPFLDGPIEAAERVMAVNVTGTLYCARAAGLQFRKQKQDGLAGFGKGSFIATASMSGHVVSVPRPQAVYNASKAAIIQLSKSLAVEWAGFARVNSVSPGYIATDTIGHGDMVAGWEDKTPMGRIGHADELKGAYLYLASDAASYTTGCDMIIDGGYTLP